MAEKWVKFIQLHCNTTEDNTGPDNAYLKWDGTNFWGVVEINDGQTKDIDRMVKMNGGSGKVELWDEDTPDPDDFLGSENIQAEEAGQGEKKTTFTGDDASYWLTYKVVEI
ncbi:hypothetical protein ACIRPH_21105 [Nocardiopsis sp. NPDC101807]|uniref:hypothetical protein n=1 Tax=Nocardiopsis sp. NPDC101807 TaxID=3364339 RepID=UPI00382A8961